MSMIRLSMQSTNDWSTQDKAQEFVEILVAHNDFLLPEKYDARQPERFRFDAGNVSRLIDIWASPTEWLLLKRAKPFPLWMRIIWWYREYRHFNEVAADIDERYWTQNDTSGKVLSLAKHLYRWGSMTHGYICHQQDWDTKNYFGTPTKIARGKVVSTGGLWLEEGCLGSSGPTSSDLHTCVSSGASAS